MPFRTPKRREALGQSGRDYADAVIEFLEARGYLLDSRAEDTGEQEDLVFVPKMGTRPSIVAEAKHRDEGNGFSPNDYKVGFGERFREWEAGNYEGYEFHFFISTLSNKQLWKDLFDSSKEDVLANFFNEKICTAAEGDLAEFLSQHDYTRFERFVENTVIWGDYSRNDLTRVAERAKKTGDYDYNPYLETYETVPESGNLRSNLLEITELPETLYRIPALDGTDTRSFYRHEENQTNPIHYHGGTIYSLVAPDDLPEATRDFCLDDEAETVVFEQWATDDPPADRIDISKALLRGLLTMAATEADAVVTRERNDTRIYMPRGDTDITVNNRWVTRQLDKTREVRHRAIVLRVKHFADRYFYTFVPKQEFTQDGRIPVAGDRKEELAADFSPARYPQNRRKKQTVDIWETILAPSQTLDHFRLPEPLQQLQFRRVDDLTLERIRPPKTADERKELIEDHVEGQHEPDDQTSTTLE